MDKRKMKKLLILNLPYFLVGLFATNLGEAWRLAEGADSSAKILSFFHALPIALNNPFPSFHPLDLLIGILCGAGLRLAVYLKGKNAKKYRHNVEYGSARWGTAKDIEPFIAPKFEDNVILTKTERLMMSNRPKNPANARNKNVLIIGGSGSGKTRFWLKPNLLQMHSSYVVSCMSTITMDKEEAICLNEHRSVVTTVECEDDIFFDMGSLICELDDICLFELLADVDATIYEL
jgi:type IV secretion system protein VirD4